MTSPNKKQKIEALVKLVQRRCRGAGLTAPPQRTVLETLMYAALLENAPFDKAGLAYTVLENYYIDWNEIRVCSVRELADTLTDLPHPEAAAERIRKALQGIFEKTYMFDFEEMRKKGKAFAEHIGVLESMSAGTPYMIQYTAQVALDAHLIPLDEASLRILRRLGLTHVSSDGMRETCSGLEREVLKKDGLNFAARLHHFAAGFYDVPDDPELLSLMSKIDPEAVNRSWAAPVLTSSSSSSSEQISKAAIIPAPKRAAVGRPKAASKPEAKPAAKPAAKPVLKNAPVKPPKPASKSSKKPVETVTKAKIVKKTLGTKAVSSKKPVTGKKPGKSAPVTKKVKAAVKRSPKTTVKKPKRVSPSKLLRKKKPK